MMRVVAFLVFVFTAPAFAQGMFAKNDWALVMSGQYGKYYVDRNSIRENGDIIGFTFLSDFAKPEGEAMSFVQDAEIDCPKFLFRTTSLFAWTQHQAKGRKIDGAVFPPELAQFYNPEPIMNIDYYNLVKLLCS